MHQMRLRYGSTILDMQCASAIVRDYVPQSPNISTIDFNMEALADGGERKFASRRNVAESISVLISGSHQDDVLARRDEFERVLRAADDWQQRRGGSPVYIEFQPGMDTSASWWRSEILDGKIQGDKEYLSWTYYRNCKVPYQIFWTRRYYWEGPELEVPIYNYKGGSATGGTTGGVTIYNHDDWDSTRVYYDCGEYVGYFAAASSLISTAGDYAGFAWYNVGSESTVYENLSASGIAASAPLVASTFRLALMVPPVVPIWITGNASGQLSLDGTTVGTLNATTGAWSIPSLDVDWADCYAYYTAVGSLTPHTSWVAIAGSNVKGSVPSFPRVEITNTTIGSPAGWKAFSAITPYTASPLYTLQAESAAWYRTGGGITNGPLSGSKALILPIPDTNWNRLAYWTLAGSQLNAMEQRYFRVLANLTGIGASTWLKLEICRSTAINARVIAETPEVQCASTEYLQDLGVLQLPPWSASAESVASITLILKGRQVAPGVSASSAGIGPEGGTFLPDIDLTLDALTFMPIESWHIAEAGTDCVPYNTTLKITENDAWATVGGSRAGGFERNGRLQLWPSRDQRFYLLWEDYLGRAEPYRTSRVQMYYRPRRLGF